MRVLPTSYLLFLLVWTVIVWSGEMAQFMTFTSDHQRCILISAEDILISAEDDNRSIVCEDLPYVVYFRSLIESSSTNSIYNRIVAERVLSLYDDLNEQLLPVTLDSDYIRKNLPGYYSWLQRNRTNTNVSHESILIHPISFGIPSQNIVLQVPPKNKTFCRIHPGVKATYSSHEALYKMEIRKSLYVITHKKSGWDCLRHNEILSSGS